MKTSTKAAQVKSGVGPTAGAFGTYHAEALASTPQPAKKKRIKKEPENKTAL